MLHAWGYLLMGPLYRAAKETIIEEGGTYEKLTYKNNQACFESDTQYPATFRLLNVVHKAITRSCLKKTSSLTIVPTRVMYWIQ